MTKETNNDQQETIQETTDTTTDTDVTSAEDQSTTATSVSNDDEPEIKENPLDGIEDVINVDDLSDEQIMKTFATLLKSGRIGLSTNFMQNEQGLLSHETITAMAGDLIMSSAPITLPVLMQPVVSEAEMEEMSKPSN